MHIQACHGWLWEDTFLPYALFAGLKHNLLWPMGWSRQDVDEGLEGAAWRGLLSGTPASCHGQAVLQVVAGLRRIRV